MTDRDTICREATVIKVANLAADLLPSATYTAEILVECCLCGKELTGTDDPERTDKRGKTWTIARCLGCGIEVDVCLAAIKVTR